MFFFFLESRFWLFVIGKNINLNFSLMLALFPLQTISFYICQDNHICGLRFPSSQHIPMIWFKNNKKKNPSHNHQPERSPEFLQQIKNQLLFGFLSSAVNLTELSQIASSQFSIPVLLASAAAGYFVVEVFSSPTQPFHLFWQKAALF